MPKSKLAPTVDSGPPMYPRLLTFEAFCPIQRTTAHIPMYDCVIIHWDKKQIQYYCLACTQNHTIQFQ